MAQENDAPSPAELLARMSLEEKARFTSGDSPWDLASAPELGIPATIVADGPHGVRKQAAYAEFGAAEPATCFPSAVTLASTWDPELLERVGTALGGESRFHDVLVLLGPGLNIKRSPLGGRNFEYFSEDPLLSGRMAAALVRGIQSQGVGACVKHFAANNQETDRMRVSARVSERALREIYLAGFELVVRDSAPWMVMAAYNRINGVPCTQNRRLLTEILREEWGYDGVVVSDWGAVYDRVASLEAGLDLEMPGTKGVTDREIVRAIEQGSLEPEALDESVSRVLGLIGRHRPRAEDCDFDAHHELAREACAAGSVLIKNDPVGDAPLLPLSAESAGRVAVFGEMARTPRIQGGGSSLVNATRLATPLDALRDRLGRDISFAPGYGAGQGSREELLAEAERHAAAADTAVVFVGLPDDVESEGFDRTEFGMPEEHLALVARVAARCPRTVVVLTNGSVIDLASWHEQVPAILESWLGGQAFGDAVVDVLFGDVDPGGRLAESVPLRLTDTASYGNFPGECGEVVYGEGVLVGYRFHDAREMEVAYPFGFGLSYTQFEIRDVDVTPSSRGGAAIATVAATVRNVGSRRGSEVVQVYVAGAPAPVFRPPRELKAWQKVFLSPGEETRVTFELDARDFSYWHPQLGRWALEPGTGKVWVGRSSRDLGEGHDVRIEAEPVVVPLGAWSTIGEFMRHPVVGDKVLDVISADPVAGMDPVVLEMNLDLPMKVAVGFNGFDGIAFTVDELQALITEANG